MHLRFSVGILPRIHSVQIMNINDNLNPSLEIERAIFCWPICIHDNRILILCIMPIDLHKSLFQIFLKRIFSMETVEIMPVYYILCSKCLFWSHFRFSSSKASVSCLFSAPWFMKHGQYHCVCFPTKNMDLSR